MGFRLGSTAADLFSKGKEEENNVAVREKGFLTATD